MRKVMYSLLFLLLFAFIYPQYKAEVYFLKQKQKYPILVKNRISYVPITIHYFLKSNRKLNACIHSGYLYKFDHTKKKINAYSSIKDYDCYFSYCYFNKDELDSFEIKRLEYMKFIREEKKGKK